MSRPVFMLPALAAMLPMFCAAAQPPKAAEPMPRAIDQIQTVVVIYGENRSFDNLYGLFPKANGIEQAIAEARTSQSGTDGKPLAHLPPVWVEKSSPAKADPAYPAALPNAPFRIDLAPVSMGLNVMTRDLVHRFYQNQMQINGGKNDRFAAISDSGALTMGYYDGSSLPLFKLAQEYTLADNFFMSAFGGSFLNHIWFACACTPLVPEVPDKFRAKLNPDGSLKLKNSSPANPFDGPPEYEDGSFTPDGFAVNTVQPPYQPSGIAPAPGGNLAYADSEKLPLPPMSQKTIGDTLTEGHVKWKWYAGGWNRALADRNQIYKGEVNLQAHHQPYNYFKNYAPGSAARAEHLKDGEELFNDIAKGTLPQVTFYKPNGPLNEHAGYANVLTGDQHIADLVKKLQASKQWKNMAIIITYDENGGFWDHVTPPQIDRWGPGSRIPAIVISPFAKKHHVDHTPYDTTSILKFLSTRFRLPLLPGIRKEMGDLSNVFEVVGK